MRTALVPLNIHSANVAVSRGQAGLFGREGGQARLPALQAGQGRIEAQVGWTQWRTWWDGGQGGVGGRNSRVGWQTGWGGGLGGWRAIDLLNKEFFLSEHKDEGY